MPLTPGSRLGPYEIGATLGEGGMGQVYRARDTKLSRDVALKVVLPAVANDPERLARFKREAHVLASLNHPNIAAIYGFEDASGVHALVMELVDGQTLAERIEGLSGEGAGLPFADALPIAKQIADALEAAHEQGIVHRDLKPANIKIRPDGAVKVLDFGLAKAIDPATSSMANASLSPTLSLQATQAGLILGTAAYMSPEQAKGRAVDKRADIWAFGVVLYEMISGRRGYLAEDVSETLAAVLTRDVDWTALPPDTPPRLQQLLRDCLVRDPKQRLRDVGEARRVLDRLISGAPDPASTIMMAAAPATPWWKRAAPWTIAALAIAIAIGFPLLRRPEPQANAAAVTRSRAEFKDLNGFVALSGDGTRLAYTTTDGANGLALALRRLDEFEPRTLSGSAAGVYPLFSPDGRWIAFSTNTESPIVKKIPSDGGTPITLCSGNFGQGAAWGPDDSIVFPGANGLMKVSANGGTPQPLTTADKTKGERHTRPQFLPDGRRLLFTVSTATGSTFALLDLEKGSYRTIVKGGENGRYAPTGHLTYVREGTLFALPFDLDRVVATGFETPVVEHISAVGPVGTADYTFSDTGVFVYSEREGGRGTSLASVDRKGAVQTLPGEVSRLWGTGRLSPDGRRVANAIQDAKQDRDIWVVDLDRGAPTRLTFAGYNDFPIWTPDGRHLLYGVRPPKAGVYAIAADGGGQPELVVATEAMPVPTSIAPDGKTLLYQAGGRTMVLPLSGMRAAGDAKRLRESAAGDRQAEISPDGKWVAFTSTESGGPELYVMPFPGPGPKVRVSTQSANAPRWNRNGRELLYWGAGAGNASLMSAQVQTTPSLSAGVPTELFKMALGSTWDVSPDGQHFLIELTRDTNAGSTFATVTNWFDELRRRAPAKK